MKSVNEQINNSPRHDLLPHSHLIEISTYFFTEDLWEIVLIRDLIVRSMLGKTDETR